MGHLDAAERGARWAQEALSGSDQELRATHNLALILDERGLVAEEAALYEDVHSTRREQLGVAHPDSLRTACNLGRCYNRLMNTDAAVALLTETRSAALATLGDADELTLAASHNLSETRAARGEYAEARQLALASLDARRRVCGGSSTSTRSGRPSISLVCSEPTRMAPTTRPYNSVRLPRPASRNSSAGITRRDGTGAEPARAVARNAARGPDRTRGRRPRASRRS